VLYIPTAIILISHYFSLDKLKIVLYSYQPFGHIAVPGCRFECKRSRWLRRGGMAVGGLASEELT
jgi:hypothetical protein